MTNWRSLTIDPTLQAHAEVVFVPRQGRPVGRTACLDRASAVIRATGFDAGVGRFLDVVGDTPGSRLILVSMAEGISPGSHDPFLQAGGEVVEAMRALRIDTVRLPASHDVGGEEALRSLLLGALLHGYRLDQGRFGAAQGHEPRALVIDQGDQGCAESAIRTANPINRARAWTEQPANLLTPEVFAQEATAALEACGAMVRTLHLPELEVLGMGGLLAVGRASVHEPKLLVVEWRGAERPGWDAALVGKGVTFDAGGLNIKTRPVIEKMKFDMGGAAAVLGAIELAASRRARVNVVAVVPMAENVIGGRGVRPGDVIRSLAGLTVEVANTDAEGRLLLADGVTYAIDRYQPAAVVDVATLTGAITGVLHEEFAGVYASDERLAAGLLQAGNATGELLWRLPLVAEQDYLVDSSVADVANVGAPGFLGLGYGSPAAGAKFIQRFTKGLPWAHIDIAGTAWATRRTRRAQAGATGFGVALLDRWLADLEG